MLKEVHYKNWKSFSNATLYIDPLTVLIGTNASGKSNALDGIAFLSRVVQGKELQTILSGDSALLLEANIQAIRGGVEWAAKHPHSSFTLEAVIEGDEETDYHYSIEVSTKSDVELVSESLVKIDRKMNKRTKLFTATAEEDSPTVAASVYNGRRPKKKPFKRSVSVISQLKNQETHPEVDEAIQLVVHTLENVFILDPAPALMRDYKPFSNRLASNASNVAGVLAALPKEEKKQTEKLLSKYVSRLPEGDVQRVWAEPVGRFKTDAMLYCEEQWPGSDKKLIVDARGMSDGTLRFIGILTALLTRPKGSLIVIEEIDNGLHPSRAGILIDMLNEIGTDRQIDILMTTHNPALLDELGPEMIPFIIVAHRSMEDGASELTPLEDIQSLPKLLAGGSIGKLVAEGEIEETLSWQGSEER
ncbi:AAA family ATPase [Saccharococcus thermophilus]|uniref:Putative ATPase n=1 Tax=Saccharococcus thermophilus TaxID=29396 RepID=A0A846MFU1_9BACL|nr:ATP-binding protein [Saccharococcus thermophilus]NIK14423.1 putative ATPase [Saccharococcus thermophilus]